MTEMDGRGVRKLTLRVPVSTYLMLDDLARAARVPLAVAARSLLVDRAVKAAPPLQAELAESARELIRVLPQVTGNLRQLVEHASAGGPLLSTRLPPVLTELQKQAQRLNLAARGGEVDGVRAEQILAKLAPAASKLNELARELNTNGRAGNEAWRAPLANLRAALEAAQ